MKVRNMLESGYPLTPEMLVDKDCYRIDKGKYLFFYDDIVKKNSIESVLDYIREKTSTSVYEKPRTVIVVGKTNDAFRKTDLCYDKADDPSLLIVFYLMRQSDNKIFMDASWIFPRYFSYSKYVKKINEIVVKGLSLQ
jgi:hypothetical protein